MMNAAKRSTPKTNPAPAAPETTTAPASRYDASDAAVDRACDAVRVAARNTLDAATNNAQTSNDVAENRLAHVARALGAAVDAAADSETAAAAYGALGAVATAAAARAAAGEDRAVKGTRAGDWADLAAMAKAGRVLTRGRAASAKARAK